MSLIVTMAEGKPSKSSVTLIQETRKFLRNEIYPYLKDEMAAERFKDYLEEEAELIKKFWDKKFDQEETEFWRKWNKI